MSIIPSEVTGVLVTRGDVDIQPILDFWPAFGERIVWNNSDGDDQGVYGRWLAVETATSDVVFVQDDDCLVPAEALLAAYDGTMLLNIPPDEAPLVGWGAVLTKQEYLDAHLRYLMSYRTDDLFRRCSDVIVTDLNEWQRIDLGHFDLPWATNPDRMYRQPDHYTDREEVRVRCRRLLLSSISAAKPTGTTSP